MCTHTNGQRPVLEGTFVQSWLVSGWNDKTWQKELTSMKEAGLKILVFCLVNEHNDGSYIVDYPSEISCLSKYYNGNDLLDICLKKCSEFGIKVFVGINGSEKWWTVYSLYKDWLFNQMDLGNQIASEVYKKYKTKYPDAFYGWYWIWELFNMPLISYNFYGRDEQIDIIAKAININLDYLTALDKDMPLMLSPFANDRMTAIEEHFDFWNTFIRKAHFRSGDILCPQDAVGAGWTKIENLDRWFSVYQKALLNRPDIELWANNENFDHSDWSSSTLDRFIKQMEITSKYAVKHITFSYNHYYSPSNIRDGFHKAYIQYMKEGILNQKAPASPENIKIKKLINSSIELTWDQKDNDNIAGYNIYRDGLLAGNCKSIRKDAKSFIPSLETTFTDKYIAELTEKYEIEAFDFYGNKSPRAFIHI